MPGPLRDHVKVLSPKPWTQPTARDGPPQVSCPRAVLTFFMVVFVSPLNVLTLTLSSNIGVPPLSVSFAIQLLCLPLVAFAGYRYLPNSGDTWVVGVDSG